ncbi:hypothetical protein GCM10011395_20050 [Sphingomonas psychrolutea]|uniref:Secreted protein n=1 Tax=Sphingomonas psychrolutea TaxID=1259676 RepID=A0ABQ1GT04_9SPHN|nr:hypothetical protein GCM10011395_20050 [Sphingomonas psychrolutea]
MVRVMVAAKRGALAGAPVAHSNAAPAARLARYRIVSLPVLVTFARRVPPAQPNIIHPGEGRGPVAMVELTKRNAKP